MACLRNDERISYMTEEQQLNVLHPHVSLSISPDRVKLGSIALDLHKIEFHFLMLHVSLMHC